MKSEEVKAIINPIYEQAMKNYQAKNLEKAVEALHSNAVFVHKGVDVSYGKKSIIDKLKKLTEEYGEVKFEKVNQTFCGCECCLCTSYEWKVDSSKKGKVTATIFQIYKKEGDKWKNYHHEMEIHDK
ncbi:unnamed protein product [Cylicocyclus nassatus]|uniref:DUF4440 domain-containing protein n=1 Tax=Cylicocyclus nassatus TaxID=53992 RepID=A0AA36GJH6_CYLNA|nr:unnamed protein product [Cylicocyclus nassatus]